MPVNDDSAPDSGTLSQRVQQSKGQEIVNLLDRLAGSRYMVDKNHERMHEAADTYDNRDGSWFLEDPNGAKVIHHEFLRCLHNYLSSLYTLFEHADTFQGRLDDSGLEDELMVKVEKLKIPARGDFLRGLRSYYQHREPIRVNLQERFQIDHDTGERSVERSLLLDREDLREFDGWPNQRARMFVQNLDDQIDLLSELDRYQDDITTLYEWLEERVRERYAEELKERHHLVKLAQEQQNSQ